MDRNVHHNSTAASTANALHPNLYVWFVFLSALDLMLTWVILFKGGYEANAIANGVLLNWGLTGFVIYKFTLVTVVLCICEYVGRMRPSTGRFLARAAVVITSFPVFVGISQLLIVAAAPYLH